MHEEINDQTLEKRLKSLTSFINKLEPCEDQPIVKLQTEITESSAPTEAAKLETHQKSDEATNNDASAYYDMISEKAKQSLENNAANAFNQLSMQLDAMKASAPPSSVPLMTIDSDTAPTTSMTHRNYEAAHQTTVVDFNLEKIKQLNQLNYPRLAWNKHTLKHSSTQSDELEASHGDLHRLSEALAKKNSLIDAELMRFFDVDQLCKHLECYYKCKHIQSESFDASITDFIQTHSALGEFQLSTLNKHAPNLRFSY